MGCGRQRILESMAEVGMSGLGYDMECLDVKRVGGSWLWIREGYMDGNGLHGLTTRSLDVPSAW